ncbi:MAG: MFS transporter [Vicinamibacterales bacterium]
MPSETTLPKLRRRLIPFLFLLYVVAYLDRVNVGFAALEMNAALGFSAAVYGLGSGIFFLSYTAFEVPSNLLLARFGARVWIARIMATWGLVSSAMLFVSDETTFYTLRFLLGVAEAGFFPGIIYYLTRWFPARERAHAVALFMTATAMAGVIGAPISSALLAMHGAFGLDGWQWLFLIEGIPAIVLAPVVLKYLDETPADAAWLDPDERAWLSTELARERTQDDGAHHAFGDALRSGRLWALSLLYFCIVMAFYGVSFWLPQIVQSVAGLGAVQVALISAIPYVAAALGMAAIGRRSDRTGERRWHVAVPALVGAAGFVLATLVSTSLALSLLALSIAALGIWGALGPFWAMPAAFLRGTAAAGGIAVVNSVGNLGGFVGPALVGYAREWTGSFAGGLLLLSGTLVAGAAVALLLPKTPAPTAGPPPAASR